MANGQEENGNGSKNRDGTLGQLTDALEPIIDAALTLRPGPRFTILGLCALAVILAVGGLTPEGAEVPILLLVAGGLLFSVPSVIQQLRSQEAHEDPLAAYCRRIREECDQLELQTITRKAAVNPEAAALKLNQVYVPLDVRGGPPQETDERGRPISSDQREGADRWPVAAAAARHKRLVLLGDQGSGKSTFVRHLAACLAGEYVGSREFNADKLETDWPHERVVPIFLRLREYAAGGLMQGRGLRDFLWDRLRGMEDKHDNMPRLCNEMERRLKRPDGVLLILDGYDEVPDAARKREVLRNALHSFATNHPECRILVTGRPYAYEREEWRLPGFDNVRTLEDLSDEQIARFIEQWFRHVGEKDTRVGPERAARYAEEVKHAVETNEGVRELAPRPLLLTLMVSLHWWRGGGLLPDRRHELYEEAVELLLDLWQRRKTADGEPEQGSIVERLGISLRALRRVLELVAYEAQADTDLEKGEANIPVRPLAGALVEKSEKDISFEQVVAYMTDRAGILIEREQKKEYAFPHRSFQEYLAACHLLHSRQQARAIIERLREDDQRWREVALLAVARATADNNYFVWDLLEEGLDCDQPPSEPDYMVLLRVTQAMFETGEHERVPDEDAAGAVDRLRELLQRLCSEGALPPLERADAGRALARLGDRRPGVGLRGDGLPDILWQEVPAGTLMMGSSEGDPDAMSREVGPGGEPFAVEVGAFRVSAYPITYEEFAPFVEKGEEGYLNPQWWTKSGLAWRDGRTQPDNWEDLRQRRANEPVIYVTWYEAHAYCRWLTELLGRDGEDIRLPTEAEWEWMARGPSGSKWPWGDQWEDGLCNSRESEIGRASAVGLFPGGVARWPAENDAIVHDLAGNVFEWCASRYADYDGEYPRQTPDKSLDHPDGAEDRVVRGGAWYYFSRICRGSYRNRSYPTSTVDLVGFRVVCLSPRP